MAFYDPVSGRHQFVSCFHPNMRAQFGAYAKGYRNAAKLLSTELTSRQRFPDYDGYPLVFLYRHAFELSLKHVIYTIVLLEAFKETESIDARLHNDHELVGLAAAVRTLLRGLFPSDPEIQHLVDEISRTAVEYSQLDKRSYSYRYPIDKDGNPSTTRHQAVDAKALSDHMDDLLGKLEVLDFGLQIESDAAQNVYQLIKSIWP